MKWADYEDLQVGDVVLAVGARSGSAPRSRWASSVRWAAATSASRTMKISFRRMPRSSRQFRWCPEVNMQGKLIGINTAISPAPEGLRASDSPFPAVSPRISSRV